MVNSGAPSNYGILFHIEFILMSYVNHKGWILLVKNKSVME